MIKHFFNCILPVYSCNFRCNYCFVHQTHAEEGKKNHHLDADMIKKALTIERCGKSFMNLCSNGETLLQPEIIEIANGLLENGHIVAIVTNLTYTKKIDELCGFPLEYRNRLFIKASFHYEQLIERNLVDVYFDNIKKLHAHGISYSMEIVASDDIVDDIDAIMRLFDAHDEMMPQIIESRETVSGDFGRLTSNDVEKHIEIWSRFDSDMFNGMQEFWGVKRNEFCYAGEYSAAIDLKTGFVTQCDRCRSIQNIYQNIDKPLMFCAVGENCQISHCYISYVWQRLCGNIKSTNHRPYYLTRNRRYPDGTEWLSKEIKQEWSSVIGEKCGYYSEKKETIVGGIMDAFYKGCVSEIRSKTVFHWFTEKLSENSSRIVVIYGFGRIGRYVYDLLSEQSDFDVAGVIDRNPICPNEDIRYISIDDLNNKELSDMNVDTVIVTPLTDSFAIEERIHNIYGDEISVFNILYEINKEK